MRRVYLLILILLLTNEAVAEKTESVVRISAKTMEIKEKGEVIRFLGDAKLFKGEDSVFSDIMEHYKNQKVIVAHGNVRFNTYLEDCKSLAGSCGKLVYEIENKKTVLKENPKIIRIDEKDKENRIEVAGDVINLLENEKTVSVRDNARLEYREITAQANFIDYNYEEKKVLLHGGPPHLYQKTAKMEGEYQARLITVLLEEETIVMEGEVKGIVFLPQAKD